ncbi:GDF3 factor, partial [Aegithalos caudatus]|nr:GDF3 factor [Aegithalos caudatus]
WASRAAMWLLRSLAWALLGPVLATEPSRHENSLLKSLGLSARPSPRSPGPVPPVLWRMFQKRKALPRPDQELDPCRVEEFHVPGNIVRVFADRGTAAFGAFPGTQLRSFPESRGSARSWVPGNPCCEIPRDAGGDGLWVWSPGAG